MIATATEYTTEIIQSVFGQFKVSKGCKVETVNGVEMVSFEYLSGGSWCKVWAIDGHPVIVAGKGEMAGSMVDVLTSIARDEAYEFARLDDTRKRDSQAIASEILKQLGGKRFVAMTGAKNLGSGDNALSFKLPSKFATDGINYVKIQLTSMDDYTVTFGKIWGTKYNVLKTVECVYCDSLRDVFEEATGLYTSL